jgi:hypothetical protein
MGKRTEVSGKPRDGFNTAGMGQEGDTTQRSSKAKSNHQKHKQQMLARM